MSSSPPRTPKLQELYTDYLRGETTSTFLARVKQHYQQAAVERLAIMSNHYGRRAAIFTLVSMGDYAANPIVGAALADTDRHVREIARQGIAELWRQTGDSLQQKPSRKLSASTDRHGTHRRRSTQPTYWRWRPRSLRPGTSEAWHTTASNSIPMRFVMAVGQLNTICFTLNA